MLWLLCYATVPLTTTFFWFSISSLCVYYNVHSCSAMLLSLLQPPFSGSLSVPCVSTTMCMVALLVPLTTTFFWFSISSLCVHYNVHGCSAMLLSLLQPPSSGSLSVPCVSTTMCMVALLVPLTTTFFWFSISSLCVHYNVHGCSAMLLSLLQPPSSGSLSDPCVSATMCMVALLCYCPSYNHLFLVLYQFPVCPLQCAWLLC